MPREIPDQFQLLPVESDDFSPDEELAGVIDPDEPVAVREPGPAPFGMTWLLDPESGRVLTYGSTAVEVSGADSVRVWAQVALSVKRFAHLIFSEDYGMSEPDRLIGRQHQAELNAEYARDVRETLLVHDRITDVRDFRFRGGADDDHVEMDCDLVLDDDQRVSLAGVALSAGTAP